MISNIDLWNFLKQKYPNFASQTAKWTKDTFTEKGFEALQRSDLGSVNEFFNLSIRAILNRVEFSNAKDPLDEGDFGESFGTPYGGYLQRIAVNSVKPVSPAFKNLENFTSPDPFVVRKGSVSERFFEQNFDYQSLITIPDDALYKNMFVSEYGISEFVAGLMQGLNNGWILQKYVNKLEALNAYLNSIKYPLKDTQNIYCSVAGTTPTPEELVDIWVKISQNVSALVNAPQTDGFNSFGFASTQNRDSLRILMKQGYKSLFNAYVMTGAYNPEYLALDLPIIEVPNFGGLVPYADSAYTTRAYPVYDTLGTVIGYSQTENSTTVTISFDDVFYSDPNEDVIAIVADRALLFESTQNGYEVEPIRNPRGRYNNYWASAPNNFVGVDPIYNALIFRAGTPTSETTYTQSRTGVAPLVV